MSSRVIDLNKKHLTLAVPAALASIEVRPVRLHGLETWKVLVNGTELTQFMSEGQANAKAIQYAQHLAKVS